MPKDWKIQEVQELTEKINSVSTFFVTEYRGLTVKEMWELRGTLRQADAEYKVVHNRLMKIAMENTGYGDHKKYFVGPVGVVFAKKDPAKAAKALMDFAKAHEKMVIKAGLMGQSHIGQSPNPGPGKPPVPGSPHWESGQRHLLPPVRILTSPARTDQWTGSVPRPNQETKRICRNGSVIIPQRVLRIVQAA